MTAEPSPRLRTAAKATAALGALFLGAASLWFTLPGGPGAWIAGLFVAGWQWAPIGLAAACAYASNERVGQLVFLALAFSFVLLALFVHIDVMRSTSSTASIALITYPVVEFAAWIVTIFAAALLGWRARDSWLED